MSNRPDPAVDFVGSIRWLMERFDRFEKYVKPLDPEKRITAHAAARLLGLPEKYFYQPWRVPGFAESGSLHTLTEWKDWMDEKGDKERRQEFDLTGRRELKRMRATA